MKTKDKKREKEAKNCKTCSIIRGYSLYGSCAHCNSEYSSWTPQNKK